MCERLPYSQSNGCIDRCISREVVQLAAAGADPWSSCCGHGEPHQTPFVLVHNREAAAALGYEPEPHLPGLLARSAWRITPRSAEPPGDEVDASPDWPRVVWLHGEPFAMKYDLPEGAMFEDYGDLIPRIHRSTGRLGFFAIDRPVVVLRWPDGSAPVEPR